MTDIARDFVLGQRTRLPEDLCYLVRRYPRDTWGGHPNLGEMARFWMQRHDMFREMADLLSQSLEEYREERLEAGPFANYFVPRLQFFLQQLTGHHQIEELHYFPVFAEAEKKLRSGFGLLDNDHHQIHASLLRNARLANEFLGKLCEGRDAALQAAVAFAGDTEKLTRMLMQHLWDEEDLVIPVILDRGEERLGLI